jgi:hypothetical protein
VVSQSSTAGLPDIRTVPQPQKIGATSTTSTFSRPVRPAQQAPPLLAGTNRAYVYVPPAYRSGTPYSPSGYTLPSGRAAVWSPVSHQYIEVHHYYYEDYGIGSWRPYHGYYGCLNCFDDSPYAYAPVPLPFAPTEWTQPTWAYWLEIGLFVLLVLGALAWLDIWLIRVLRRRWRQHRQAFSYST